MDGQKPAGSNHSDLPIRQDAAVELDVSNNPEIESVKPIFRPAEKMSEPIKSYWKWVWLVIVLLVIIVWAVLFIYFSNHHAPFSAPLR
jgi:hypothetical protein